MYAVVQLQGHQYIVTEGDVITVDKIETSKNTHNSTDVLAIFSEDGSHVSVGAPLVDGASVDFSVEDHKKGKKLHVYKFKNKNRYSRKIGFRAHQTVLKVISIKYGK